MSERAGKARIERYGQSFLSNGVARPLLWRSKAHISGVENLPDEPFVYGPFHDSMGNIFAGGGAVLQERPGTILTIAAKEEIDWFPLGPTIEAMGCEFVKRGNQNGESKEERDQYVEGFARRLGERACSYPDGRGVVMIFPEGTRDIQLTEVKKGPILVASVMADILGHSVRVVVSGQANDSFPKMFKHLITSVDKSDRVSIAFGEGIEIPAGLTKKYSRVGRETLEIYQRAIEASMRKASDEAREVVGLPPLKFIGKVPPRNKRRK